MHGFKLLDKKQNKSLGFEAERYLLDDYGSEHIHLRNDSKELVFMVMFRTIPENSTGVAHILEHTTLCGSEKFKVRDPFFMMLRRSMSTFMNAFTSSDWTAYPFATQNKKDFYNLLDVYLDAAYFPILEEEDFKQEGHRLEFSKLDKSSSDLEYKGVVFNEMKGSMSNISSVTWQALTKNLFPDLTYRHNSGGEPKEIIELTHDYLKNFHSKFYHPSNATYFTWGDIDAKEIQKFITDKLKNKFENISQDKIEVVKPQKTFKKSVNAQEDFNPVSKEQSSHQNYCAWVLGESSNIDELLESHLTALLLLGNSATPLYKALESNDIGKSPAQILGLEDSMRHLMFICGIEGSEKNSQSKFNALIDKTFADIVKNGFKKEQIDAALYQLELNRREISAGSLPYGLQILLSLAPGSLYKSDPLILSNVDEALKRLKENVKKDNYLQNIVKRNFVDNQHRVNLEMIPDLELINKKESELRKILDNLKASMSSKEKLDLVNESKILADRQNAKPNKDVLPKLELSDVPKHLTYPKSKKLVNFGYSPTFYEQPTNGLTYQSITRDVNIEGLDQVGDLMILSSLLGRIDTKGRDYLKLQEAISKISGGINASSHFYLDKNDELKGKLSLSSKSLPENSLEVTKLMFEILDETKFDNDKRIKELVFQNFMGLQQTIVENGHRFAMLAASSSHSKLSLVQELSSGLSSLYKFAPFVSNNEEMLKTELEKQAKFFHANKDSANKIMFVSNIPLTKNEVKDIRSLNFKMDGDSKVELPFKQEFHKIAMPINTQVNFSAISMDAPMYDPKESANYLLLSSLLRNEYLHKRVREQGGAYGGGAAYDPFSGTFKMFSYRDPRFIDTIQDFENSLEWALKGDFSEEILLEAKLSVLSDIDKPSSPAGEAFKDYRLNLEGKSQKDRSEYRNSILEIKTEKIIEAAKSLKDSKKSVFSIINPNLEKTAQENGFQIRKI